MGNRSDVQCRYHFFQLKKSSKQHEKPHKPRAQKMMVLGAAHAAVQKVAQQQEKETSPEVSVTSDDGVLSLSIAEPNEELDLSFPNVHFDEPVMPFFDPLQDSFLESNLAFNYFDL